MAKKKKTSLSNQSQRSPQVNIEQDENLVFMEEAPQTNNNLVSKTVHTYEGPIPPARELARYNEILPDAAERIMAMAEQDAKFQQEMGRLSINFNKEHHGRGQLFGLIVSLSAFILAGYFGSIEQPEVAGITIGGTVVSLTWAFVAGRRPPKEKKEKKK